MLRSTGVVASIPSVLRSATTMAPAALQSLNHARLAGLQSLKDVSNSIRKKAIAHQYQNHESIHTP